jgi:DNA polymerase
MKKVEKMQAIYDEIVALTDSPLYTFRVENNYVPVIGAGSLSASVMFVGEAPGEKEAKTGVPFCGRSGKVLDTMLTSVNLTRDDVYITSVVKDRPQDNRDPTKEEIALYGPFLDRQLDIIKPKVVVLLGRYGMNYIFEKAGIADTLQPISKIHGEVFIGDFGYGKVKLLPLYHPAVGLYSPKMRPVMLEDFKKIERYT